MACTVAGLLHCFSEGRGCGLAALCQACRVESLHLLAVCMSCRAKQATVGEPYSCVCLNILRQLWNSNESTVNYWYSQVRLRERLIVVLEYTPIPSFAVDAHLSLFLNGRPWVYSIHVLGSLQLCHTHGGQSTNPIQVHPIPSHPPSRFHISIRELECEY